MASYGLECYTKGETKMNYPLTLEQYIAQAPMRELELARMGAQIAEALSVIHKQGKVHGDVKPGNILVVSEGCYQLIGMERERMFPLGTIPAFVAPELIQGGAYHPGIDVYSLGMMMQSLIPKQGISEVFREMIQKACEPDPSKRYESALAFSEDLEMISDVLGGETQILCNQSVPVMPAQRAFVPNNPVMQQTPYGGQPAASPVQQTPYGGQSNTPPMQQNLQGTPAGRPVLQPNTYSGQPGSVPDMQLKNTGMRTGNNSARNTVPVDDFYNQGKKKPSVNKETQKASLALRFVLPILIVLIVAASVIAYIVLIRPDKTEDATTEQVVEDKTDNGKKEDEDQDETPKEVKVPNIEGKQEADAKKQLEDLNLVAKIEYVTSDTVEKGVVIKQDIAANTKVEENSEVLLTISEGNGCPYEYSQKVTVSANTGSTSGNLTLYNWENGGWVSKFSCSCVVGKNGIGSNYGEGKGVTPLGTFKLGYVLGTQDPGNGMVFKQAGSNIGIVDDVNSPLYNVLVYKSQVGDTSVDPVGDNIASGKLSYVIFIEHNGDGLSKEGVVAGKGSAITICGNNNSISATAGCVDITASNMTTLLQNLDGSKNPYIEITVN